jgi:ankyrin repeat protein
MFRKAGDSTLPRTPDRPEDLFSAVAAGDRDAALRLLRRNPEFANVVNGEGRTPLHLAVLGRHAGVARLLLDRGADVNARTSGGCAPLHLAARRGYALLVGMLLNAGADPDAKDLWGNNPREHALRHGHRAVARMLRDHRPMPTGDEGRGRRLPARERIRPAAPRLLRRLRRSRPAVEV